MELNNMETNSETAADGSLWLVSYEVACDREIYRPYLRKCDVPYAAVVGMFESKREKIKLNGLCHQFGSGEQPAKIILDLAIRGIMVDFHEIDDENGNTVSVTDMKTNRTFVFAGGKAGTA